MRSTITFIYASKIPKVPEVSNQFNQHSKTTNPRLNKFSSKMRYQLLFAAIIGSAVAFPLAGKLPFLNM